MTKTDTQNDDEVIIVEENENTDEINEETLDSETENKGKRGNTSKAAPLKFTREAILSMDKYAKHKYLLSAKLEAEKTYTTDFVDKLLESEKKRGVK